MRFPISIPRVPLLLVLLLAGCYFSSQALPLESPIPSDASNLLRHKKHGILAYGCDDQGRCGSFLITKDQTFFKQPSTSSKRNGKIRKFREVFRRPPNASDIRTSDLYLLAYEVYLELVHPFRKELDELYQITIFPGQSGLEGLPFEALVIEGEGAFFKRRFMTEVRAISYLSHFDFLPVEQRLPSKEITKDPKGAFFQDQRHPNSGTVFSNRHGRQNWLPKTIEAEFWRNVDDGNYIDEALGLARSTYFDSLRTLSTDSTVAKGLDPRHWASAAILGDIAPTHPKRGFPWWILVPLGFILVVVFGRKL